MVLLFVLILVSVIIYTSIGISIYTSMGKDCIYIGISIGINICVDLDISHLIQ